MVRHSIGELSGATCAPLILGCCLPGSLSPSQTSRNVLLSCSRCALACLSPLLVALLHPADCHNLPVTIIVTIIAWQFPLAQALCELRIVLR